LAVAESLLLEALTLRRELNGDYHLLTASTLNNLAEVKREGEQYFEAINYHNAAIESFTKAGGVDHPGTINAKGNLGVTLRRQAKQSSDQGEALVREAYDYLQTKKFDAEHPWVVKFGMEHVIAQAQRLAEMGKHEESVELYDSLINKKQIMAQITANKASPDKPASQDLRVLTEGRVAGLINKATTLFTKGQYSESLNVYESFLQPSQKILGSDHTLIIKGKIAYSQVLLKLAKFEPCKELLEEALQQQTDLSGVRTAAAQGHQRRTDLSDAWTSASHGHQRRTDISGARTSAAH
jgi:tetratricopeptide (TPR) repeat protein